MDRDFLNQIINISYLISLETPVHVTMYDGIAADFCPYCNYTSDDWDPILSIDLEKNTFYCRQCGIHRDAAHLADFYNDYNDYDIWEKLRDALKE